MMAIIIALIPAVAWGLNPTIVGKIGGKPIQQQLGTAFGAGIFAVAVYAIFRPEITAQLLLGCIISGLFWSFAQLLQYKSYTVLGTGKAYAISTAANLIINALLGIFLMNDWAKPSQKILGFIALAVIIIGAATSSYSQNKEESNLKLGVIMLIVAGVGYAVYSCAPTFVNAGGVEAVFPQAIGMVGGSLFLSLFEKKDIKKFDKLTAKNMIPGFVWAVANITLIYSNKMNSAAVGFSLSMMSVVVSTFATLFILKEKKSKKEMVFLITGTIIVAVGGIMIGLTKL